MHISPFARTGWARRFVGLGMSLGVALAALLVLRAWAEASSPHAAPAGPGLSLTVPTPLDAGRGINVVTSTLLLTNSIVSHNSAAEGGGIYNSGHLDIENSIIQSNQAITRGGGLYVNSIDPAGMGATLTLHNSQVISNAVVKF